MPPGRASAADQRRLMQAYEAFRSGNHAAAEIKCRQVLRAVPNDFDALSIHAQICIETGKLEEAERQLAEALAEIERLKKGPS